MPGLHIDEVGGGSNPNIFIETNYEDLKNLVENNLLVPGQKYLITDYLHKYLINESDTSPIEDQSKVTKTPYNYYTYFKSGVSLSYGAKVTLVGLPLGYGGSAKVGAIGTVTESYGDGAHRLSGIPPIVGAIIAYSAPRFENPYIDGKVIRERFNSDQTGTISTIANSNIITGSGTLFTQEFAVGETISYFVNAGYRYDHVIKAINSDTEILIEANVLVGDIATDVTIEKITFGKVILQPGGLINTEVHNGEAYSGMTAAENQAPQTERLVLTAISKDKFSTTAISDTYLGDIVEYDFFDNEILDLTGKFRDTRKGLVYKRKNEALKIDVNKDWRVQRFRKFRCYDEQWERFRNLGEVFKLDSGSQVYQVGGISSLSYRESKRYIFSGIKDSLPVIDFTVEGTKKNVFTDGEIFSPSNNDNGVLYGTYYDALNAMYYSEENGTANKFQYSLSINFNEIKVKDYFIFPIENHNPKELVKQFRVTNLEESIFSDEDQGQGKSEIIDVVAKEIKKSTALTGGYIRSINESIYGFVSLEDFKIVNSGKITHLLNFSKLNLNNKGEVAYCQIGGAWIYPVPFVGRATYVIDANSLLLSCVLAVGTTDNAANYFSNTVCKDVLLKYFTLAHTTITLRGAFFSLGNSNDANYGGNTWFQRSATKGCALNITPGFNRIQGIEYTIDNILQDLVVNTDPISKQLYTEKIIEGKLEVEVLSLPLKRTDTAIDLVVDNDAPVIGNNVVFTITATHVSATPATNTLVNALLPDGYTFVSSDSLNYDNVTGEWKVGDLATGTSKILKITATVTDTGNYEITANLSTTELEITPADNSATITIIPTPTV